MTDNLKPPDPHPSAGRSILAFLALLAIFLSQIFFYVLPDDKKSIAMDLFWLAIIGIVVFLLSQIVRLPASWSRRAFVLQASTVPLRIMAGFLFGGLATVGMILLAQYGRTNYIPVVTLWFAGALVYTSAFLPHHIVLPDLRAWLRSHWKELLAVGLVTLLAAALRFYMLGDKPQVINGDEGWLGIVALSTMRNPMANPFSLWENFGAIYLQTVNYAFSLFGPTAFSLRLLPAISGTLAVPALYLFARQISGRRIAWIAAFLLAISHSHMNFSRTAAVGYIHDTWIVPLVLYLLLSGLEKRSLLRTTAAGLLLGLQFNIYLTAQIIIPMIVIFAVIVLALFRKRYPMAGKQFLAAAGGLLVVILPNIVYGMQHPDEFFNRLNVSGTFQSGWLVAQMEATGRGAADILVNRFLHAFFSLIYYPAIDFYNSPVPLVSIITASLFLLGLGLALWKTRKTGFLLLNLYFWCSTAAIGLFAIPASADSYRMIVTLPAVMFCAAYGFDQTMNALGMNWHRMRAGYGVVTAFLLVTLFFFNEWEYRVDFAGQCRYGGDMQTRFASYMGSYIHDLRRETTIYLLSDDIFWYGTHASASFLGLGKNVTNVPEPIESIPLVPGDVLIASPNRIEELIQWERTHPGGNLVYYYDCDTQIMASYQTP
jgi:4-amino-4-deoxy-L-arabinose transferase-like glycosyltransferase